MDDSVGLCLAVFRRVTSFWKSVYFIKSVRSNAVLLMGLRIERDNLYQL